jgi:ribosomal 30S subunit maturation factor RimM
MTKIKEMSKKSHNPNPLSASYEIRGYLRVIAKENKNANKNSKKTIKNQNQRKAKVNLKCKNKNRSKFKNKESKDLFKNQFNRKPLILDS